MTIEGGREKHGGGRENEKKDRDNRRSEVTDCADRASREKEIERVREGRAAGIIHFAGVASPRA